MLHRIAKKCYGKVLHRARAPRRLAQRHRPSRNFSNYSPRISIRDPPFEAELGNGVQSQNCTQLSSLNWAKTWIESNQFHETMPTTIHNTVSNHSFTKKIWIENVLVRLTKKYKSIDWCACQRPSMCRRRINHLQNIHKLFIYVEDVPSSTTLPSRCCWHKVWRMSIFICALATYLVEKIVACSTVRARSHTTQNREKHPWNK